MVAVGGSPFLLGQRERQTSQDRGFLVSMRLTSRLMVVLTSLASSAWGAECISPPSGLVGWWAGNDTTEDNISGSEGVRIGGVGYAPGKVGNAFSFPRGGEGVLQGIKIAPSDLLDVKSKITIVAWIKPAGDLRSPIVEYLGHAPIHAGEWGVHMWIWSPYGLYFNFVDINGFGHGQVNVDEILDRSGGFQLVSVSYDKATGKGRIYLNGKLINESDLGAFDLKTGYGLNIGLRDPGVWGDEGSFSGLIDEVQIFDRALEQAELLAIYNADSAGLCGDHHELAQFTPRAQFNLGPKANDDSYWVRGWLKLADTSNGINPLTEAVTIKVGPFSHTLPAGSFTREGDSYVFKGPVGASVLDVRITGSSTPGGYSFKSCLKKADLEATTLKPDVQLTIGDDSGQATLDVGYAKFGKGSNGKNWVFPLAQ